ncbi:MAG: sensor signal transduction histidine kinase [Chitinophagaceae bacterium]|nr:sensor signal transduction histidine kinase [Chitinophagaceae bacterium]
MQLFKDNYVPDIDFFELLLNTCSDAVIVINSQREVCYYNLTAEKFCHDFCDGGLARGEKFFSIPWANKLEEDISAAFSGESNAAGYALCHEDSDKYFTIQVKALTRADNAVDYLLINIQDISEAKKIEEEKNAEIVHLTHTSKHLQNLFNSSLDIICTINSDGEYVQLNEATYYVLGYRPEEMAGKKTFEFILEEDQDRTTDLRNKIIKGSKTTNFENRLRRKDGSIVTMAWSARWDDKDGLLYCTGRDASEMKTAEEALLLSEKRFRALVQSGSDLIGIIDQDAIYQYVSPTVISVLGYNPRNMIGKNAFGFVHEEDQPKVLPYLELLKHQHQVRTPEFRYRNAAGEWRWIETVATNMFDVAGVNGIVVNSRDITERKMKDEELARVLNELKSSEKKLLNIFENFPNGAILIIDKELKIEYLAGKEVQSLQISSADFINTEFSNFLDKTAAEVFRNQMLAVLQDKTVVFEISFMSRNYMLSAMPQKNEAGDIEKILIVSQNITAQKEALHRIHIQSDILENVNNLIIVTDNNYKINYFNNLSLNVFNEQIIDQYGKEIFGIFPNLYLSEIREMLDALKDDEVFEVEVQTVSPGEKDMWIDFRFSLMYDQFDETIGILCMGQDITAKKEADYEKEQLIEELNATVKDLRQFAYITSHNLRSPISNLIGITNLIEPGTITDATTSFLVEKFKESAIQLNETVNDLMNVLLIKNSVNTKIEDISIHQTWQEVCASVNNIIDESGAVITTNFSDGEMIQFNKSYLESVLLNLLTNSIKYKSATSVPYIDLNTFEKDEYLVLEFSDNGLGIDLERHGHKIFGLYQRFHDHPDSKGLGLYLVNSQVKALGGKIEIESEVGKGTTFFIYFKNKPRHAE